MVHITEGCGTYDGSLILEVLTIESFNNNNNNNNNYINYISTDCPYVYSRPKCLGRVTSFVAVCARKWWLQAQRACGRTSSATPCSKRGLGTAVKWFLIKYLKSGILCVQRKHMYTRTCSNFSNYMKHFLFSGLIEHFLFPFYSLYLKSFLYSNIFERPPLIFPSLLFTVRATNIRPPIFLLVIL